MWDDLENWYGQCIWPCRVGFSRSSLHVYGFQSSLSSFGDAMCLYSIRVVVNGNQMVCFRSSRGLRQKEINFLLVSLFSWWNLFLWCYVIGAWEVSWGIKLARRDLTISHLLILDDSLLFGSATIQKWELLKHYSKSYCCATGRWSTTKSLISHYILQVSIS